MPQEHVRHQGFTLIELMIVVILIAIGAALAAPSFSNIIRESRLTTQANNLLAAIQLARSEAVRRGVQVTLRRNGNINQNWSSGWQVFTDWDADGQFDGNINVTDCSADSQDCLLRAAEQLSDGMSLRTGNTYATWLAFAPTGLPVGSGGGLGNDTFRLCDARSETNFSRALVINNTGRPTIEGSAQQCP